LFVCFFLSCFFFFFLLAVGRDILILRMARFGLPLAFLERRVLLDILYTSLPDPSRVLVGKSVVSVEQEHDGSNGMTVRTHDGSSYHGDLVVGADGVHSRVRQEMWRLAELEQPGLITGQEKNCLSAMPSPP
jgi:2-polyprenyl-6-methoxyphenol hydroxylase-like FAD-dependent oxidoreductase